MRNSECRVLRTAIRKEASFQSPVASCQSVEKGFLICYNDYAGDVKMKYLNYKSRYGKPPFFHPVNIIFVGIIIGFVYRIIKNPEEYLAYIAIVCMSFVFYRSFSPFWERFSIDKNTILVKFIKYAYEIKIPENAVFVISYTNVDFSQYFRKRFMINIVDDEIDKVFEILHSDKLENQYAARHYHIGLSTEPVYDNAFIQGRFKNRWIYSFVYEKDFADEFFKEQKKTVILPKSLKDKINIIPDGFKVIIDEER